MLQNFDEWLLETDPELLEALDGWRKWAALGMLGLTGMAGIGAAKRHLVDGRPLSDRPNVFRTQKVEQPPQQSAAQPVTQQVQTQQAAPKVQRQEAPKVQRQEAPKVQRQEAPAKSATKAPLRLPKGTAEINGNNFTAVGYGRLTTVLGAEEGREIGLQRARQSALEAVARKLGTSSFSTSGVQIIDHQERDGMVVVTIRGSIN